jgi:hypothetical protein
MTSHTATTIMAAKVVAENSQPAGLTPMAATVLAPTNVKHMTKSHWQGRCPRQPTVQRASKVLNRPATCTPAKIQNNEEPSRVTPIKAGDSIHKAGCIVVWLGALAGQAGCDRRR